MQLFALLTIFFLLPLTAQAECDIYSVQGGTAIVRSSVSGIGAETIFDGTGFSNANPNYLAAKLSTTPKLYFSDTSTRVIWQADIDGSNPQIIVSGLTTPEDLALDEVQGKLYWADSGSNKIQRANLDGTVVEDVVINQNALVGLAIDTVSQKIYWSSGTTIRSANVDGSNIVDVVDESSVDGAKGILALELSRADNLILWSLSKRSLAVDCTAEDPNCGVGMGGLIRASALDGSNVRTFLTASAAISFGPLPPSFVNTNFTLPENIIGLTFDSDEQVVYYRRNNEKNSRFALVFPVSSEEGVLRDVFPDSVNAVVKRSLLLLSASTTGRCQGNRTFDSDSISDFAVWRTSEGNFFRTPSDSGYPVSGSDVLIKQWGLPGDVPFASDFDGDSVHDLVVWRPDSGNWFICSSTSDYDCSLFKITQWGLPGDYPLVGDFDGDGLQDTAVWRPSLGMWFGVSSSSGKSFQRQWGLPGDRPVSADFDNDGITDLAVWRPSNGVWYILQSSNGFDVDQAIIRQWGLSGDHPMPGDFDGDGSADIAVWRPGRGFWFVCASSTNYDCTQAVTQQFGLPGDMPIHADFDGDGKDDFAVWRRELGFVIGFWFYKASSNDEIRARQWGLPGDVPLGQGVEDRIALLP